MRQATQDTESATNSKDAQAILNLNLKLQSSAAKAQGKTIDFDLKRLQVAQLAEHLDIVTVSLASVSERDRTDRLGILAGQISRDRGGPHDPVPLLQAHQLQGRHAHQHCLFTPWSPFITPIS